MTTMMEQVDERAERPLAENGDSVARVQTSTAGVSMVPDAARDRPDLGASTALDRLRRVAQEPRSALMAVISAMAVGVLVAVIWALRSRSRPHSSGEILLERSRETFDRSGDALEALVAKLVSSIAR
jgi:hypothetical protein